MGMLNVEKFVILGWLARHKFFKKNGWVLGIAEKYFGAYSVGVDVFGVETQCIASLRHGTNGMIVAVMAASGHKTIYWPS